MKLKTTKKGEYVGDDMHGKPLHIGDTVGAQQCWEDQAGHYHDESGLEISGVYVDGTLRFRIGHWKTRKQSDEKIQACLNACEWYPKDVEKED